MTICFGNLSDNDDDDLFDTDMLGQEIGKEARKEMAKARKEMSDTKRQIAEDMQEFRKVINQYKMQNMFIKSSSPKSYPDMAGWENIATSCTGGSWKKTTKNGTSTFTVSTNNGPVYRPLVSLVIAYFKNKMAYWAKVLNNLFAKKDKPNAK